MLDIYDTGYFDLEEFKEIISKFIAHWCIMTGTQVKVDKEGLRELFLKMDVNKDGIVDLKDYKDALKKNPQLFSWFDILNQGVHDSNKAHRDILDLKFKTATDVMQL